MSIGEQMRSFENARPGDANINHKRLFSFSTTNKHGKLKYEDIYTTILEESTQGAQCISLLLASSLTRHWDRKL